MWLRQVEGLLSREVGTESKVYPRSEIHTGEITHCLQRILVPETKTQKLLFEHTINNMFTEKI